MKLLALFCLMMASSSYAESIKVVDANIPFTRGSTLAQAEFYMDTESSLGYAKVKVQEETQETRWTNNCRSFDGCFPELETVTTYKTIYSTTELIPSLVLEGDKMVYLGSKGAVDCGTLGKSRVFRAPTLYLSGKCKLTSRVLGDQADKKVEVDLLVD